MIRRPTVALAALAWGLLAVLGAAQEKRPNIVFIFADDHAQAAISAYGSVLNLTPNIDRIAKEGAIFRESFCANSICAPSRATVLTGRHSHRNGKCTNGDRFDANTATLPIALRAAGYRTAIIGKWHLQSDPVGFDEWEILPGQGNYYNPDFRDAKGKRRVPGYVTDLITERALTFLRAPRENDQPFLLMVHHKAPHRNWMPSPEYHGLYDGMTMPEPPTLFDDWSGRASTLAGNEMTIDRHMFWTYDLKVPAELAKGLAGPSMKGDWGMAEWGRMTPEQRAAWDAAYAEENAALARAKPTGRELVRWKYQRYIKDYLRCIASVDDSVGAILDELERSGRARDTIVVYSSDQGFYLGDHGWYDKRWIFEESLRMPLLMRWPARIAPGTEIRSLVQNIDYAPTFLDAAGVTEGRAAAPDGAVSFEGMDGHSLVGLVSGREDDPAAARDLIYYAYYEEGIHAVSPHDGIRTARHKLAWFPKTKEWQLFDLVADPHELKSVHADPAAAPTFLALKKRYLAERRRLGASHWPDPPSTDSHTVTVTG
ncbi:MAG: sulfatase [Planctomycetota bacterium]